ncbi:MAG: hypothetical protein L3J37_11625 [Rhodobacteraceae bacterium]|nr:hypothetical protein [Paracoccaceae bacterium]
MPLPTAHQIASLYLYGSEIPSEKFDDSSLIRQDVAVMPKNVSKDDYFDPITGPGRFALGSEYKIIQDFFDLKDYFVAQLQVANSGSPISIFAPYFQPGDTEIRLTKKQFAEEIMQNYDYGLIVANRSVADGYDDYAARTFIWNTTQFALGAPADAGDPPLAVGEGPDFVFWLDGQFTIENFLIEPRQDDNFDFDGGDLFTNLANNLLEQAISTS